jgi:aryl-alcohol dehydrogenase-like predicted oxidoreductase
MAAGLLKRHPVLADVSLGIGTWSWGDRLFWGYGRGYSDTDIQAAFQIAASAGIRFFDTAEVYGQGKSETLLGKYADEFTKAASENGAGLFPFKIATKFMPYPWRLNRGSLVKALQASLKRLGVDHVDLYQVHMPLPPINVETWMAGMIEAHQMGLINSAGVSNYDRRLMQRAFDALTRQGIQLASNQVEYHLLNRKVETNGLMAHCHELGITLIAYSPLGLGLLSGKYTPEHPPQGARAGRISRKYLAQIQPLLKLMRRVGADHEGKTPAQVAINWVIQKGALPIPGVKNLEQAEQNIGACGWNLSPDEVAELDEMSDRVTREENG